jgi:hypothetical protein
MPETEQRNINPAALPHFHTSSGDNVLFCKKTEDNDNDNDNDNDKAFSAMGISPKTR